MSPYFQNTINLRAEDLIYERYTKKWFVGPVLLDGDVLKGSKIAGLAGFVVEVLFKFARS